MEVDSNRGFLLPELGGGGFLSLPPCKPPRTWCQEATARHTLTFQGTPGISEDTWGPVSPEQPLLGSLLGVSACLLKKSVSVPPERPFCPAPVTSDLSSFPSGHPSLLDGLYFLREQTVLVCLCLNNSADHCKIAFSTEPSRGCFQHPTAFTPGYLSPASSVTSGGSTPCSHFGCPAPYPRVK